MFCKKCGNRLEQDADFCNNCGLSVTNKSNERKMVFEGKIHKCPNCGEVVKSFVGICPACGFEFNDKKVSETLQKFIDKITECERKIVDNSQYEKNGWSSWSRLKKTWWIILNIFLCGIPIIISLYISLFKLIIPPKLTREERQMKSLIENFPFPNDRESIITALLFIKEKMLFISKEKISRKNAYWLRLWCLKAEQLKHRADLMTLNDSVIEKIYSQILNESEKVNKKIKIRTIIGVVIFALFIMYSLINGGVSDENIYSDKTLEIPVNELSSVLPKLENGKGKIETNNSEYFSVEYYEISSLEFENYKQDCINFGYNIDVENNGNLFEAYNGDGYNIRILYYNSKIKVTITDNMEVKPIIWPKTKTAKLLPVPKSNYGKISSANDSILIVYVANMSIDDYNNYVNDCIIKGFEKDIVQTDNSFSAKNKKGYSLTVEYRGYNIIFIRIDD